MGWKWRRHKAHFDMFIKESLSVYMRLWITIGFKHVFFSSLNKQKYKAITIINKYDSSFYLAKSCNKLGVHMRNCGIMFPTSLTSPQMVSSRFDNTIVSKFCLTFISKISIAWSCVDYLYKAEFPQVQIYSHLGLLGLVIIIPTTMIWV